MKFKNIGIIFIIVFCSINFLFPRDASAELLLAVECTYKTQKGITIGVGLYKDTVTGRTEDIQFSKISYTTVNSIDRKTLAVALDSDTCPTLYESTTTSSGSYPAVGLTDTVISTTGTWVSGVRDIVTGTKMTMVERKATEHYKSENESGSGPLGDEVGLDCTKVLGKVQGYIQVAFNWIRIIAPIALILFGGLDFGQAVIVNDQDALKKSTAKFSKRAIAALAIFFLPLIINIVLSMPGLEGLSITDAICGIK